MRRLRCRRAQIWMQAPEELSPAASLRLTGHLSRCLECQDWMRTQEKLDVLLRECLALPPGIEAIRERVRARLEAPALEPRSTGVRNREMPSGGYRPHLLGWVFTPLGWRARTGVTLVLVAAVLSLMISQMNPNNAGDTTQVHAAFHLVRPQIGYPMAVDETTRNHLLAGAGGRVYESWDAGQSWKPLAPLPPHLVVRDLAVDPCHPRRYLVAAKHSVFVSDDRGRHWTMTASFLAGAMNMFVLPDMTRCGTFYLGPSVLWKSTDGGTSWSPAGRGRVFAPDGIQALSEEAGGRLYTGIWHGGVAVSRNGGRTWQRRGSGLAVDVMDVSGLGHTLWAATDRGVFQSHSEGARWTNMGPASTFFATTVLPRPGYVVAAGKWWVFRSTDGGKTWQVAMKGLPLEPYVYSLYADPFDSQRVYASLDSDGLFRSDNGGRTWTPVDSGLPVTRAISAAHLIVFLRRGVLWITDTHGADPGALSVDTDVRRAVLSPDGEAVAYVAASRRRWAVRVIPIENESGLAAQTLAAGSGVSPERLTWSPNSSLVVISRPGLQTVRAVSGGLVSWRTPRAQSLVGWLAGRHALLFWSRRDRGLVIRSWSSGRVLATIGSGLYPAQPLLSPGRKKLAFMWRGRLLVGQVGGVPKPVIALRSSCSLRGWSDDGTRLLLRCGRTADVMTVRGSLVSRAPVAGQLAWEPGSDTGLLVYRGSALWLWRLQKQVYGSHPVAGYVRQQLVSQALPVQP